MAAKKTTVTVNFEYKKATKNTICFNEILASELDPAKIGTIYIQKTTLKSLGWTEGKPLTVTIS